MPSQPASHVCGNCTRSHDPSLSTCPFCGAPAGSAATPGPGSILDGKYEILSFLGGGSMGNVFKARHLDGGKRYSDWRRAFANSLRANWYGLWAIDPDGSCRLTAKGQQAKRVQESEQRTEQAAA